MPSRILHVIPTLEHGGLQTQVRLLTAGLCQRGWEVHVAALGRSGSVGPLLVEAGATVTEIGRRWPVDPAAYWRLKNLVRSLRPDVVHTHLFAANSYGRWAARAAGVKHLFASERYLDRWKLFPERWLDCRLAKGTERIVVNSAAVRDFYAARGLPAEKLHVISGGVPPFEPPADNPRAKLLAELGLPTSEDIKLVAAIGPLVARKKLKDAIWAAELLKVVRDDVHLLIVGDGPYLSRLERYRHLVEIDDRVHFLGDRSDVPRLLPHLTALWQLSVDEGQSSAVMEALAAGVPVIASDTAGLRELITAGETGLLIPVGDPAALARKTQTLLKNPALAEKLGAAGRERVLRDFSAEQMIARHDALYRESL